MRCAEPVTEISTDGFGSSHESSSSFRSAWFVLWLTTAYLECALMRSLDRSLLKMIVPRAKICVARTWSRGGPGRHAARGFGGYGTAHVGGRPALIRCTHGLDHRLGLAIK